MSAEDECWQLQCYTTAPLTAVTDSNGRIYSTFDMISFRRTGAVSVIETLWTVRGKVGPSPVHLPPPVTGNCSNAL
jgi:hypothetical protein